MKRMLIPAASLVLFGGLPGCQTADPSKAYLDLWEKGQAEVHSHNFEKARSTFKDLLGRYPGEKYNPYVELLLADCEKELGNEAEARKLREKVARSTEIPELKMRANLGLGMMALEKERFDEAASRFKEAIAADAATSPGMKASLHYQAGLALQKGGRFEEAREQYRKAQESAPGSKTARYAKTQLLYPDSFSVQTGAFQEAANAEKQRALLAKNGFPAEVVAMEFPQGKFHCVRVGKLKERKAAKALLDRIQAAKLLPESSKPTIRP